MVRGGVVPDLHPERRRGAHVPPPRLGFGSYPTGWALLHRLRRAMVRPGRERRSGVVELDDPLFGGVRPGKRGRGAAGKTLVAVAVELHEPKGFGRCRLRVIPNAKAESLDPFLRDSITPGSTVVTDGLKSYPLAVALLHNGMTLGVLLNSMAGVSLKTDRLEALKDKLDTLKAAYQSGRGDEASIRTTVEKSSGAGPAVDL